MPEFKPETLYDSLFEFSAGFNSGVAAVLLPKNQLALGINTTVRGTFVRPRPAWRTLTLDFGGDGELERAVKFGKFQGGTYYKPDFGPESLVCAISGRLFQFIVSTTTAQVVERTIPGDPNPPEPSQAWLWQAEKWVIWMDGQSVPVFFDGMTSRRSIGESRVVGTTGADFVIPAVNDIVAVTLQAPGYSGPTPAVVLIDGAQYEISPTSASTGYGITLENINATAGVIIPAGETVLQDGTFVGLAEHNPPATSPVEGPFGSCSSPTLKGCTFELGLDHIVPGLVGKQITFSVPSAPSGNQGPFNFKVTKYLGFNNNVADYEMVSIDDSAGNLRPQDPPDDTVVTYLTGAGPSMSLGTLKQPFTVPAVHGSGQAYLSNPYTGEVGQVVSIDGKFFKITAVAPIVQTTSIDAKNLTGTPGVTVVSGAELRTIPELPPGRMGTYGLGRNWFSLLDGRSFLASDIVGGSSGTKALDFRDAVLKTSENSFINAGGTFRVPGSGQEIRFMRFVTQLDVSLGQGPLMVGTPNTIFSCQAPVDNTIWSKVTNPILTEALKGAGGLGQDSSINANGDLFFRSLIGFGSLILGRRDFDTWGNVPISRELERIINDDDVTLLQYSRAIIFDNRALMTVHPVSTPQGVRHASIVALNFDPISSLRGKAPAVWDGIWTDLNVLHLLVGEFAQTERAFALVLDPDSNEIGLRELLPSSDAAILDDDADALIWEGESSPIFRETSPEKRRFKRLQDGEVFIDDLQGTVDFQLFYRPDDYPCWVPWLQWSECAKMDVAGALPQFRPRMGLGEPSGKFCDDIANRPLREGYYFQIKLIVRGHCRFKGARFKAVTVPEPEFAPIPCGAICEFAQLQGVTEVESVKEIVFAVTGAPPEPTVEPGSEETFNPPTPP